MMALSEILTATPSGDDHLWHLMLRRPPHEILVSVIQRLTEAANKRKVLSFSCGCGPTEVWQQDDADAVDKVARVLYKEHY